MTPRTNVEDQTNQTIKTPPFHFIYSILISAINVPTFKMGKALAFLIYLL
jgi:hypothetical protein